MVEKKIILEVCADSVNSAIAAQAGGAQRIELCSNIAEGGTTPSFAQIVTARRQVTIPLYVLIRPRAGDFLYNDTEFEIMQTDIDQCGKSGCNGVVVGILNADGTVDTPRCQTLIAIAHRYKMGVTFHRAFDRCLDLPKALETVIQLGCERILTSGGRNTAAEGAEVISRLIEHTAGRVSIMPGAGITPANAAAIVAATGATELHGTFRRRYDGGMLYRNVQIGNPDEEYSVYRTDKNIVHELIRILNP